MHQTHFISSLVEGEKSSIVRELTDQTLHSLLQKEGKLFEIARQLELDILEDVVLGLQHLHRQSPPIPHGNLKSENILIRSDWRACLCDGKFDGKGTSGDIWSFGFLMREVLTREVLPIASFAPSIPSSERASYTQLMRECWGEEKKRPSLEVVLSRLKQIKV